MPVEWIVRVDTASGEIVKTKATPEEMTWGGRMLIAKVLLREVPPTCEVLGRHNKLILASGLLSDTPVTTTGKLSIGGKSPLTKGVKESNVGGYAGKRLARLGIRALILEGIPREPGTGVLFIGNEKMSIVDMPSLKGLLVGETIKALREEYGSDVGIICIGPAGEMLMYGAGIAVTDDRDVQVRYAARGGLGALMGSKGIKAIVISDKGAARPRFADRDLLLKASRELVQDLMADPKTENRNTYGTPAILALANQVGLLPTRNFSSGSFEHADVICGEYVRETIAARGGEGRSGTPCVAGCAIMCSNVFPNKDGKPIVASIQYENIALLGSNCGIGNIDDIAELNDMCNQVGVDAIEIGAAIGVAMEAGVIPFGDAEGAKDLIRQIGKGTYLGRILGHGVVTTGRLLGIRRVPAVKGQAIPAYDPRALKGNGVTYVTSPMGADHTAGNAFETLKKINPIGREKQVESSRRLQIRAAMLDSLGLCLFTRPPFIRKPNLLRDLLKGRYGEDIDVEHPRKIGEETLETEREFNIRAGVSEEFYPIPEFMQDEPLPPTNSVFDIPMDEMRRIWDIELPSTDL
jgi:aldehyde:ferredoxin oxidoreductase